MFAQSILRIPQLCINNVDRSSKLNPYFNVKKRSFRSNATCSIEIKDTDTGKYSFPCVFHLLILHSTVPITTDGKYSTKYCFSLWRMPIPSYLSAKFTFPRQPCSQFFCISSYDREWNWIFGVKAYSRSWNFYCIALFIGRPFREKCRSLFGSFDLKLYFWIISIKRIELLENFKNMPNLAN